MNPAAQQLNPVFNNAVGAINNQVPQVNNLYSSLIAGLQGGAQQQTQNVVQAAQRAGVNTPSIATNANDTLMAAINPLAAQLGAQQAGNVAQLGQQVGQTNVNRADSIAQLNQGLQRQSIASGENQLALQKAQQSYNINQTQYQVAQAKAAARAAAIANEPTTDQRLSLMEAAFAPGKDGYVSPRAWNDALDNWIKAGGSRASFVTRFSPYVNKDLYQQKTPYKDAKGNILRYNGVGIGANSTTSDLAALLAGG